jgi:hypothetical protein
VTADGDSLPKPALRFLRLLETAERALTLALDEARAKTSHPGDKGDNVEAETRDAFANFLPTNFGVGEGTVYDAYGDESAQADLVITNPDHPFRYPLTETGAYMIEGVAAVGEIKSVLTTHELKKAIDAGRKFKRLRPSPTEEERVHGASNRALLELTAGVPPFFILAFENSVAIETVSNTLATMKLEPAPHGKLVPYGTRTDAQSPIDCVCLLGQGVFLNFRPGVEVPIQYLEPSGKRALGWRWLETSAPLALTLSWLHAEIPRVARFSSISLPYFAPKLHHIDYMDKAAERHDNEQNKHKNSSYDRKD